MNNYELNFKLDDIVRVKRGKFKGYKAKIIEIYATNGTWLYQLAGLSDKFVARKGDLLELLGHDGQEFVAK